ncbi:MAG TPA: sucrose-6-phosphate hydrolase [Lachnospiraceae bacterium]|nr:sucrose-6-phosphate hydrolase [Lachnospiraceae bacterium]
MISKELQRARAYEAAKEKLISESDRPAFHLSSRVGWMNDPNGLSFYNGQYHMFYQYHPYDSHWGPMHWGHAVSQDLLHWSYLPAALAPDQEYDRCGCFSGSAVTLPDGRHLIAYTSVTDEIQPGGDIRQIQQQSLAVGDGLTYEKVDSNPVLTGKDLPLEGSKYDFRDPKILCMKDGSYRMIIANNHPGHGGQMLLFRSDDGFRWSFSSILAKNENRIGLMWECPDFFELDGRYVLIGSAQDMLPKSLEYHNGNGTFYLAGDFDSHSEIFCPQADHAVDYGIDFYAPQTVLAPDGRRIMIGWMQNWDTCNLHTASIPWFGQMSIPRELSLKNGLLYQVPIRELNSLRVNKVEYKSVPLRNKTISLPGIEGRTVDLEIEVTPFDFMKVYHKFSVRFAKNDSYNTGISFRPYESTLKINRKFSGSRRAIIHQRRAHVNHKLGAIKLRILLDRYSAEIFVNDGEKVLSTTITTPLEADGITFSADGALTFSVTKYTIKA